MDFSEFPSLTDCFAGGSASNVGAELDSTVVDAEPAASLAGAMVPTLPPADHRREGRGASDKAIVAVDGKKVDRSRPALASKGGDAKKRPATGSLSKEAPSSKSRKICKDAPPVDEIPLVEGEAPMDKVSDEMERILFQPFDCAFGGRASDCASLFEKFQMDGEEEDEVFDTSARSEWYQKFARFQATSVKFVNRLVKSQDAELRAVKEELAQANAKLAAVKDGAACSEEVVTWRKKYDAERKALLAARKEVDDLTKKIALEAERAKKRH